MSLKGYLGDNIGFRIEGLGSELLKGGYVGDYIVDYYRGY